MAKASKTSLAVPGDPETWKVEQVEADELKVGDWIHLYGTEVGRVTEVSLTSPEGGLVYEWNGRTVTGLRPGKSGEKATRIRI